MGGVMLVTAAAIVASAASNCWVEAGTHYKLPPPLLYAIAGVESSYNPDAIAHANDGTYSIGLMQINSRWFPQLQREGISEEQLHDPCTSVKVGAWILSQEVARYGYSWIAIGAYFAGPYKGRDLQWKLPFYREYSQKVLARWKQVLTGAAPIARAAAAGRKSRTAVAPEFVGGVAMLSSAGSADPAPSGQ